MKTLIHNYILKNRAFHILNILHYKSIFPKYLITVLLAKKMQFQTLILLALVGMTIALTTHQADRFSQWQTKHGIKFKTDEEQQFRKIIFQKKADDVDKHNANPKTSYKKGLNKFSHLTKE